MPLLIYKKMLLDPLRLMHTKVTCPEFAHKRVEFEFGEAKFIEIIFSKFSLKNKWHWHPTQVISYFLELCGITYKILKMKWHKAIKLPTS